MQELDGLIHEEEKKLIDEYQNYLKNRKLATQVECISNSD
jgi:hypothetical protein